MTRIALAHYLRNLLMLAPLLSAAGCGLLQRHPSTPPVSSGSVTPFSGMAAGGALPPAWYPAAAPQFRKPTRYELVDSGGVTVIRATADTSSSGLAHDLDIDPRKCPRLRWRWKVPQMIPGADNTRRETEDAPARVDVAFAGDTATLPLDERIFFSQVKALSGIDTPYATLDYIWGSGAPVGTIIVNSWTSRIRMVMVESGADRAGEWVTEERNVYDDFRRAFGEEPGRITHIAIYTDTDATATQIEAYYGNIQFLPADGGPGTAIADCRAR